MLSWSVLSLLLSFTVFVLVFVCKFVFASKPQKEFAAKIDGPKGLPLIGMFHNLIGVRSQGKSLN